MRYDGWLLPLLALTFNAGCGSNDAAKSTTPEQKAPKTETSTSGLHELLAGDWTIDPGVEDYYCNYKTLTEDLYINDFRPLMPPGTHHVVLGYQDPAAADGFVGADSTKGNSLDPSVCSGVTFGDIFSFVATVGTQELAMPEGVAVKIPAGKQLVLGLHVINTGSESLSGHSGIEVATPKAADVKNEAEVIAVNGVGFNVPPGKSSDNVTCTMTDETNVFAVLPHMHLTGVHMTTTAGPPGQPSTTLFDGDYKFMEQRYEPVTPILHLDKGDTINMECDYENPGPDTLSIGESTTKNEMCLTFTYRYPALLTQDSTPDNAGLPRSWCIK